MSDDMTIAEVARTLVRIETSMREMREDLSGRLDKTVSLEVHDLQYRAIRSELADLHAEIHEEKRERKIDRRWWVAAVGIPTCAIVLQHLVPILPT